MRTNTIISSLCMVGIIATLCGCDKEIEKSFSDDCIMAAAEARPGAISVQKVVYWSDIPEMKWDWSTQVTNAPSIPAKNVWYSECNTSGSPRVVTTTTGDFQLVDGATVTIYFKQAMSYDTTLNVDNTGSKQIRGAFVSGNQARWWKNTGGQAATFVYSTSLGKYIYMEDNDAASTSRYGVVVLSSSTNSTSESYAATPKAVKMVADAIGEERTARLNAGYVTQSVTNGLAAKTWVDSHQWDWTTQITNKPSIPAAANNGTLIIQKNGKELGTFGANQSSNTTVNVKGVYYATCGTGLVSADKIAILKDPNEAFVLEEGVVVYVKFTFAASLGSTLNVANTAAKAIKPIASDAFASNGCSIWAAGDIVGFVYDGTYWRMLSPGAATKDRAGITRFSPSSSRFADYSGMAAEMNLLYKIGIDIAPYWVKNTSTSYSAGDLVMYSDGKLYRAKNAIAADTAWNANNWQAITVNDVLASKADTTWVNSHQWDWSTQVTNKPTLGTAAAKDVPASGNATATQVVLGNDTRLTDARTPTAHTHTQEQVTGLTDALSGKVDKIVPTAPGNFVIFDSDGSLLDSELVPGNFAPASHEHSIVDVTGLTAALAGKASTSHTHAQSDITGLSSALAGKLDTSGGTMTGGLDMGRTYIRFVGNNSIFRIYETEIQGWNSLDDDREPDYWLRIPKSSGFLALGKALANNYEVRTYAVGELCAYEGKLYRCTTAITEPNDDFVPSHWTETTIDAEFARTTDIAPIFSTSSTYAVNALCVYDGVLYRCTTAVTTAGSWTGSTNWSPATVEEALSAMRSSIPTVPTNVSAFNNDSNYTSGQVATNIARQIIRDAVSQVNVNLQSAEDTRVALTNLITILKNL